MNSFLMTDALPWEDLDGGVMRQVMGYNNDLMMVKFKFTKGGGCAASSFPFSGCIGSEWCI
ncbi:MAG: hypothetical protein WCI49_10290 [Ferruginibacter sp.]